VVFYDAATQGGDMARLAGVLTDVQIRHWVRAGVAVAKADGGGLTFTLTAKGAASWVLRYRFGGKQKEITLGSYPDITLTKARELAAAKRVEVSQGVDVAQAKQARKIEESAPDTVKALCDEFYDRTIVGKVKCPDQVREKLDNDIIKVLGKIKIKDVKPHDIDRMISGIANRGAPVMANRVLALTKRVFDYAIRRHWIEQNPATAFNTADAGGEEKARSRVLSDAEVTTVLKAFDDAGQSFRVYALAMRLLLVTAVRRSELIEAPWAEFDLARGLWTIPASRQKTGDRVGGKDFVVPLTVTAIEWLNELKLLGGNSDYVFPARRTGARKSMGPNTANWALGVIKHGLEAFTLHDLRRTARTQLASLGVPPHIAERCLNHRLPGINDVYDQYDYLDERSAALDLWGRKLSALEAGTAFNVVALRAA
jgi:integrase